MRARQAELDKVKKAMLYIFSINNYNIDKSNRYFVEKEETSMTVGERIQFYRKEKNLSQEQLGQMLFVSRQTVSLWEKDQTTPTIDNLLRLKEIFGVSVDELLTGEEGSKLTPEPQISAPETPVESITVTYQEGDIRRATWRLYKNRMTGLIVVTGLSLLYFILLLIGNNPVPGRVMFFVFVVFAVQTIINIIMIRRMIRTGEQHTANCIFHYDVYENYILQTISKNGEVVETRRMSFSELTNIRRYGNLIVSRFANQVFILHTEDLDENSRFYWFLRSRANEKKKPKKKGYLTAISVILFVLSIATLWIGLIFAATKAEADPDPAAFSHYLWVYLFLLPIPVGSIVFGVVTRRKGYAYKKNIVVGIIMTAFLLIYGLLLPR